MSGGTDKESLRRLVDRITNDEQTLRFPSFSHTDAFNIGILLRDLFLTISSQPREGALPPTSASVYVKEGVDLSKYGIVISIETFTGHRLFSTVAGNPEAMRPDNWRWVEGKKNIVRRFHRSSFYIGRKALLDGHPSTEAAGYTLPEWSAHGGGFPIWIRHVTAAPIGVIVLSGLPQEMDHQLIVDVLKDYIQKMD